MSATKTNKFCRFTAVILTVAMLMSLFPLGAFSAMAAESSKPFTVTVKDEASTPIKDADVKITAAGVEIETSKTGDGGKAEFTLSDGTEYQYEVSKFGYKTASGEVNIETGTAEVTLTEKNKVEVTGQVLG